MLFDLVNDPQELCDLGRNAEYAGVIKEMYGHLHSWSMRLSQRVTMSDADIEAKRKQGGQTGVVLGVFDESDVPLNLTEKYRGKVPKRP